MQTCSNNGNENMELNGQQKKAVEADVAETKEVQHEEENH
jgi:hypothetical protein